MRIILCFVFLFGVLSAEEASFTVDAKEMEYDGDSQLLLAKDVTITFKNGSKLSSRSAQLDFESMKGVMSSGSDDELVVYTGFFENEGAISHPVVVKGRKMSIEISEIEGDSEHEIITVTAEQDVEISYDNDDTAYGHLATFINSHADTRDFSSVASSGVLTLEAKSESDPCRIERHNGDMIEASRMRFYPAENTVEGWEVKAALTSLGRFREVEVSSDRIFWSPKEGYIRLCEESNIVDKELGSISNVGTLECYQDSASDNAKIRRVVAVGKTRVVHLDNRHAIGCYGKLVLDHENQTLKMESPKEQNDSTSKSRQSYYEDKMGKIYADSFDIKYDFAEGEVQPSEVLIQGGVRMHNRCVSDPKVRTILEQYALADKVKYCPKTKEMYCTSSKGKRVLYFDRTQGIQLSAPALHVQRNPDQELEVQGKGNVRLKFTRSELELIKQFFPFLF